MGQASTLDSLGLVHRRLGDHDRAVDCYDRALALFREVGDRFYEAETLTHLGDAHEQKDPARARRHWSAARDILADLSHPAAADLEAKLA